MPICERRLMDWLRLMRLPGVFTAVADVAAGHLFMWPSLQPWWVFATLAMASACVYTGGMVLNDVMDVEQDLRERPHRPIPAGRMSRGAAAAAAALLLTAGLLLGWLAAWLAGALWTGLVTTLLVSLVIGYNVLWKSTWLGPLVMGACRGTNLCLGITCATAGGSTRMWDSAVGILVIGYAVYVMGVTWFARTEAVPSARSMLLGGFCCMLAGFGLMGSFPFVGAFAAHDRHVNGSSPLLWPGLLSLVGLPIARRCVLAIVQPSPVHVQQAVRVAILSFVWIDAGICLAIAQPIWWAVGVASLMIPALVLGRWIDVT